MSKIISDESDKKIVTVAVTGIVAVARIISGEYSHENVKEFLDECDELSKGYIELLMEAEKDPDDDNSTQVDMDIK